MKNEHATLEYTQGRSDKVYQATLEQVDPAYDEWVVNFAYGRRNQPLRHGTKTPKALNYEKALACYDKLITAKMAKGYTIAYGAEGFSALEVEFQERKTDWLPQLPVQIRTEKELEDAYLKFFPFCYAQIKHDGERRAVVIKEDIVFANRRGLGTTVDMNILADIGELIAALPEINPQLILDCEDMGDHLVIFDCIYGEDYSETFNVRLLLLHKLNETIKKLKLQHLKVDLPRPIPSFLALKLFVQNARDNQEEGVIIRDGSGSYEPGKLNSGGSVLKYKFVESATVVVHAHNQTKRSVEMVVRDEDGHWVIVGNCSIPINYAIPPVNACIEVEYLYAYEYGSLYQPVYKGERTDLTWGAAVQSQLKYKSEKGPAV